MREQPAKLLLNLDERESEYIHSTHTPREDD